MPNNEGKCPYVCDNCCQTYITTPAMCRNCVLANLNCDTKNNMCNPATGCEGKCNNCCQLYISKEACPVCTASECK